MACTRTWESNIAAPTFRGTTAIARSNEITIQISMPCAALGPALLALNARGEVCYTLVAWFKVLGWCPCMRLQGCPGGEPSDLG